MDNLFNMIIVLPILKAHLFSLIQWIFLFFQELNWKLNGKQLTIETDALYN